MVTFEIVVNIKKEEIPSATTNLPSCEKDPMCEFVTYTMYNLFKNQKINLVSS